MFLQTISAVFIICLEASRVFYYMVPYCVDGNRNLHQKAGLRNGVTIFLLNFSFLNEHAPNPELSKVSYR